MTTCLDGDVWLPIRHVDVLGIPCNGVPVLANEYISSDVVCAIRKGLFLQNNTDPSSQDLQSGSFPSFSLSYMQHILDKDGGADMSEQEQLAFKIAAVLPSQPFHAFPMSILKNFVIVDHPRH